MSRYTRRGRLERTVLHLGVPSGPVGKAILRALGGHVPGAGEFLEFDVEHDSWCAAIRGGVCRCKPEAHGKQWVRPTMGVAS